MSTKGWPVHSASAAADKLVAMPAIRAAIKAGAPGVDTKTSAPAMPRSSYDDPKSFLLDVMNLGSLPIAVRADAAFKLMPYMHARMGETGKKESAKDKARDIARGRSKFATKTPPPRLTVVRSD